VPLECCFAFIANPGEKDLQALAVDGVEGDHSLLERGEVSFYTDYSNGDMEVLSVFANPDSGGYILRMPGENFPSDDAFKEGIEIELPEPITRVTISKGQDYEIEVCNDESERARMIVRSVSSMAITKAGQVPELLKYPDRIPFLAHGKRISDFVELRTRAVVLN
jgi:hypothetical protein